jgi:hypothetical protein
VLREKLPGALEADAVVTVVDGPSLEAEIAPLEVAFALDAVVMAAAAVTLHSL